MFRACILLSRAAGTTPAVINREKSSPRALLAAGRGVVDDRAPYAAPPVHNLTAHASRTLSLARRDRTNIQCPPALERNINAKVSPSVCAHKTRASSSATLCTANKSTDVAMKWLVFFAFTIVFLVSVAFADGEIWEEDDHEILIRGERGAKNRENCRYVKGPWTECDPKNNMRSRTLTLKKGDQSTCESTKTIQKKCKKACRYEKGAWGDCNAQSQMTRNDKLKPNSDPSCEQNRQITKKCKAKGAKPTKGKAGRRNRQ
ncbi:uncharacterized protein [Atheta coriaria]|uniref:uncharacterized protein isoform X2 n=1 Tax=Dalotia coriaria TaxID=877792 RepID=UPI0031F3AA90